MDNFVHKMKGQLFQITGLPRFGSAFMSIMFSLEADCIGIHEQAAADPAWVQTIENLRDRWQYVADCSTYGYFPKATVCDSIKVYVKKEPVLSAAECTEKFGYFVDANGFKNIRSYADQWAIEHGALTVDEGQLFRMDTLEKVWVYCFRGARQFPSEKVSRLLTMNVQRHEPEKVFSIENGQRLAKEVF